MSFIPAGVVSDLQKLLNSSLPSRATNSRTQLTRDVRVNATTRDERFSQFAHYLRVPIWRLSFADGDLVAAGDSEAIARKGTYAVTEVRNPADYSIGTTAFAVRIKDASGADVQLLIPNAEITFRRSATGETSATVPAFIRRANTEVDPRDADGAPLYDYLCAYAADVAYVSDGALPGTNDYLRCAALFGAGEATLGARPDRITYHLFNLACLYFSFSG